MGAKRGRRVVALLGLIGFGLQPAAQAAPAGGSPELSMFTEQVPVPPMIDARAGAAVGLDEVVGTHRFHSDLDPTPSFGFLPSTLRGVDPGALDVYLGPTVETRRGDPVEVTVTNRLARSGPATATTPVACAARGLTVIHPLAPFVDTTLEGSSELDTCAPRTSTHLHGGHTAPGSDGLPLDDFRAAGLDAADESGGTGSVTYRYANDQEATALWYHDHAIGITRLNPAAGLAGFYLVRDGWDTGRPGNPLGLPAVETLEPVGASGMVQPVRPAEVPLVLQDRSFNADGSLGYPTNSTSFHPTWAPEAFGDVATVNGKAWPNLDVDRGLYRFRLLNGSNARFYRLNLVSAGSGRPARLPVYQIGSDGGMFNRPVALPSTGLVLAPGERADVLVDFRAAPAGSAFQWMNNAKSPFPSGEMSLRRIMQFTVGPAEGFSPPPGTALAALPDAPLRGGPGQAPAIPSLVAAPEAVRTMFLNEIIDPVTDTPVEALQNNLPYLDEATGEPITEGIARPKPNTVEIWQIVNTTEDTHPIHLHLAQFQVLSRQALDTEDYLAAVNASLPDPAERGTGVDRSNGTEPPPDPGGFLRGRVKAPAPGEQGWKDTVQANPGEVVRIAVPFGGTAAGIPAAYDGEARGAERAFTGSYVWHCHILEHEENDMMQPYDVVP